MKAQCKKKNPRYLYKDDEYTACNFCKARCEEAIKCAICNTVDGVFYKSRGYDAFLCAGCYHAEEEKRKKT